MKSTEITLVKIDDAQATAIGPDVISILAVGSDARPGEDMTHTRGDALQLVTINTRTHAASIIGVPRDSWVDIPGHGTDKINSSLYFGGPQLLGQTVGNLIGVQPKYVFVTRFPYFIAMVKSIGGIDVHNPYAFSDDPLKPSGFPAGKIHLGGYDAMAYSRIRHTLPRGDFQRSAHQEIVLKAIQAKVRANAGRARLHRARRARRDEPHVHQPPAGRAVPAGAGDGAGRPVEGAVVRRPGRHRYLVGRREHRAALRRPGARHGQPDPERRDAVPLRLTGRRRRLVSGRRSPAVRDGRPLYDPAVRAARLERMSTPTPTPDP